MVNPPLHRGDGESIAPPLIVRKNMAKKKDVTIDSMVKVKPITDNQKLVFNEYKNGQNLFLHGAAGTGKTFIALYKALEEVLQKGGFYKKVILVRSAVPSREIGHLPGDQSEKSEVYRIPYVTMCDELFPSKQQAYQRLVEQKYLDFMITSFVRGLTLDNTIVIVDECQNMNDMELNSIMTRVGVNSKIIFCGDFRQTDLYKRGDMSVLKKFMVIAENMPSFKMFEFDTDDIVRSDLVKEYLLARMKYEDSQVA